MMIPDEFRVQFEIAIACYKRSDTLEAYNIAEDLLRLHPFVVDVLLLRGRAIQALKQSELAACPSATLDSAHESLRTAVLISPRNAEALNELGYYELNVEDDTSESLRHFKAAEHSAMNNLADALVGLAKCLHERGERDAFGEVQQRLASISPERADTLYEGFDAGSR